MLSTWFPVAASFQLVTGALVQPVPLRSRTLLQSDRTAWRHGLGLFEDMPSTVRVKSSDQQEGKNVTLIKHEHKKHEKNEKGEKDEEDGKGKKDKKDKKDEQDEKDKTSKEDKKGCPECPTTMPPTTTLGIAEMFSTTVSASTSTALATTTATATTPPLTTAVPSVLPVLCEKAVSCSQCTALPDCGWCALEGHCVSGNKLGPHNIACGGYEFSACSLGPCSSRSTCSSCVEDPQCGWCGATSTCTKGDETGPLESSECKVDPTSIGWMHAGTALKCDSRLGLNDANFWDSLKRIRYRSEARAAELVAGPEESNTLSNTLAPTQAPSTSTPPPTHIPTSLVPLNKLHFTTTTTTTTTITEAPMTTTVPFETTTTVPFDKKGGGAPPGIYGECDDAPETVVDVDVCQNCKPPGEEEGGGGGGANETAAPPPPEFLQDFVNHKRQRPMCCFLHPECCRPKCPEKSTGSRSLQR